ncbi:galactose-1-phosphate uridylyltransferase [Nakamurella antarctica]|uniref:Galactose-1-phosphate uridylyltransferase n=2 Tax=Nakamurella antarctica TaxID=1902245 RepID=A0A3G9A1M0_9ACTN|nr:galactose-1-phosphate uridylyltransferase [Nakamurella antarctica]
MADGRDLIYYVDTEGPTEILEDARDISPVIPASVARYDALVGEWVGIAGHRQTRTYLPPANQCPLCPTTPEFETEMPSPDYDVTVFENRFPSFAPIGASTAPEPLGADALFMEIPGNGRCEVVCFTSNHTALVSDLNPVRIGTVIQAWADRTEALGHIPGLEQVFCFINQGAEIGVTLAHPHGQIYGYPFVTPKTAAMVRHADDYRARTGGNLFGDILDREIADGSRIVASNEHWVAFVPFAARWPVEVSIYPRRQVPDLPATNAAERLTLAAIYLEVMHRMEGVFDDTMPAITAWHQAPVNVGREEFWLHMQILSIRRAPGKLKYLAGSESGMGAFVNDITPESAAQRLRDVVLTPTESGAQA